MTMPAMAPPLSCEPEDELSCVLGVAVTVTVCRAWTARASKPGRVFVGGGILDTEEFPSFP